MALTAYFDESFNDPPNGVMTVGGFISSEKRWLWFEREWKKLLVKWKIGYFRMAEFAQCKDQFAGWENRQDDRLAFLKEAIEIIGKTARQSFAASLPLKDWDFCNEGFMLKEQGFLPYPLCGFSVVNHVFWWCEQQLPPYPKDQVPFIFEKGDGLHQGELRKVVDRYFDIEIHFERKIPKDIFKQPLGALQAADFVSWHCRNVVRKYEMRELKRFRGDFENLFARVPFYPHHTRLSMELIPKKPASGPEPSDGAIFEIKNQSNSDEASLVRFCHLYNVPLRPGLVLMRKKLPHEKDS